jgi:hypothetical protein
MPTIPSGLEPFMLSASYGLTALLAVAIWWASGRAGLPIAKRVVAWLVAMAVLVSWQLLGETLARAGVFTNEPDSLGPWMGVAVVLPVVLGLAGIAASPTARRIVEATPLWALVAIQIYRVLGAVFLVLWAGGHLPGAFALPAGLGDFATGVAAPILGYAIARWPDQQRNVARWNAFGIADLVVAVTTGFLTSPGATQMLALDAPNRLITAYPLALVPLYAVPVSLILHGLVWQRLAARTSDMVVHSLAE